MAVHHARVIALAAALARIIALTAALAAVLIGISALVPSTLPHAQQPLDGLRPLGEQGDAEAQSTLGVMYRNGESVPQDYAEAVRWYRLAADQGYADAQHNAGLMYANGQGVRQDDAEAVRWYRLAADQGHVSAQFDLGTRYSSGGRGVSQDDVEAHMWFNLAAAQSSGEDLDIFARLREAVAERMTPEQLAEAQRRAREWTPTPEA